MNFFALSGFLIGLSCAAMAALVFLKNRTHPVNQLWSIFCVCVSIWGFGGFAIGLTRNPNLALIFWKVAYIGVIFIPSLFYHFVLVFLRLRRPISLAIAYAMSIIFLIADATPLMMPSVTWMFGEIYYLAPPGFLYPYFVLFFVLMVIISHIDLWRFMKTTSRHLRRTQVKWFFMATFIGFGGGITCFLPVFGVEIYPYGNFTVPFYPVIMGYAIVTHRLFDIEVIIKKTLVFAGLSSFAFGVFAFVTFLVQEFLGAYVQSRIVPLALSVFLIVLAYEPLRNLLIRLTDRFLFQKKEDFKTILNRLSQSIITILDLEQVGEAILSTLKDSLRLESGVIILKDENGEGHHLLNSFNVKRKEPRYSKDDFLIAYAAHHGGILNLEHEETAKTLPPVLLARLEELNARLLIPLFLHQELIGILTLGKKKSDEEFTPEELDYFPAVAGQVAIALSNARLFDILKKSQIDFAQQAKMAAIGTLSAGISHEVKNPLSIIRNGLELLRFNKKMGVYNTVPKEEFEKAVFEVVEAGIKNVERATAVINRLSSFAKKPKEIKIEPVSLKQCIEAAASLLTKEFENYNIEFKTEFPTDAVTVALADQTQMEDIFLNLLVNARHAVGEKGRITAGSVTHAAEVEVTIQDTGCGIPKENLEKIFDPFFTTKDTSRNPDPTAVTGSGLGLFLVRESIRRFGGRITVDSTIGKGTTFHIFLPRADRQAVETEHHG